MLPARYHNHSRLVAADHLCKAVPVIFCLFGIVRDRHVVPHQVKVSVFSGGKFVQLGGHVVLVGGPFLRMLGSLVVGPRALGREAPPPVIVAVPVRNGEIGPGLDSTGTVGVKNLFGNVGPGVRMERTSFVRHLVVCLAGVKHAEAVVVLGGEHHVFHAGVPGSIGPLPGVEVDRIESVFQVLVRADIVEVIHIPPGLVLPGNIVRRQGPGLDDAPLAVGTPVDEHAKLQVLPLLNPCPHILLHGRDILRLRPQCSH